MTPDDTISTAKAVQYRKAVSSPDMTTRGGLENDRDREMGTSSLTRNHELRQYDTTYPNVDIRNSRALYISYLQRRYDVDLAQHFLGWERRNPVVLGKSSARDRYLARDARPWEEAPSPTSGPAMHPLWRQVPPCPSRFSSEHPPKSPLSKLVFLGRRAKSRLAIQNTKNLGSGTAIGSPSPYPSRETLEDQCNAPKTEKTETRQRLSDSFLSDWFLIDEFARELKQADYLRDQREKRKAEKRKGKEKKTEKEAEKREENSTAEKNLKLEDVPVWLKDLAKGWREKHPGSNSLFRKDFNFGPKTQTDKDDDCHRPLSPGSYADVLPDLSTEACTKAPKRQRYDSSNTDVRPQPTTSTARGFFRGLGTLEIHPGQGVSFNAGVSSGFEVDHSNRNEACFFTSDYDRNDVQNHFRKGKSESVERARDNWVSTRPQVVGQDDCCKEDLGCHLETEFDQHGKLKDNAENAQAAMDEVARMETCKLQRKLRTTRELPFVLFEPVSRSRTAEPQVTKRSPVMYSLDRTKTRQTSTAEQDELLRRRRSFLAKCRSTDLFLRDVRESQRRRQLAWETEYQGSPRQDTPDPTLPEQKPDWLGNDPL